MNRREIINMRHTAITNPCYFGFETARPIFAMRIEGGSVALTVDSGYE